jgi:hypothetical protein
MPSTNFVSDILHVTLKKMAAYFNEDLVNTRTWDVHERTVESSI